MFQEGVKACTQCISVLMRGNNLNKQAGAVHCVSGSGGIYRRRCHIVKD
jgi:hypothetical protein